MYLELPRKSPLDETPAAREYREQLLLFADESLADALSAATEYQHMRPAALADIMRRLAADWERFEAAWQQRKVRETA